jgi:hypothetical protein
MINCTILGTGGNGTEFLTKAYIVFNVSPILKKYDNSSRKEVAIEVPPEFRIEGRTGRL